VGSRLCARELGELLELAAPARAYGIGQLVMEIGEEAERLGGTSSPMNRSGICGASRRIACIAWPLRAGGIGDALAEGWLPT
jgi:hypothetical protein